MSYSQHGRRARHIGGCLVELVGANISVKLLGSSLNAQKSRIRKKKWVYLAAASLFSFYLGSFSFFHFTLLVAGLNELAKVQRR